MKGTLTLSVYDHGSTRAEISIKYGGKNWNIKNWHYFSSLKAAKNQALKLAKKLGIEITKIVED